MRPLSTLGRCCVLLAFSATLAQATEQGQAQLRQAAADLFPPASAASHQLAAVRAARSQLPALGSALLYAAISAADLQAHLPGAVKVDLRESGLDGEIRPLRAEPGYQEVVVHAAFDLDFDLAKAVGIALKVHVTGEADIHCTALVERGALVLRPSVSALEVKGGNVNGETDIESIKPLLGAVLRSIVDFQASQIEMTRIPLRLPDVGRLDLAAVLAGIDGVETVHAPAIGLDVGVGAAALLIDAAGIHILGDAVLLTPERFAATLEELRHSFETGQPPRLSSNQLAVLGECDRPPVLPESLAQVFAVVCAADAKLAEVAAPPPALSREEAEAALAGELKAFGEEFRAQVERIEPLDRLPWERTLVAISRAQLASGLNELLKDAGVQATLRPPGTFVEIPPEDRTIRTPDAPQLHCEQVGGACESVFAYPPYNPRGCPSDCGWDLGCIGWKIDCERLKEQEKLAYEAAKAAAQAAWIAEKVRCEAAKTAMQAGCRANQEWLDRTANLDLGELRGGIGLRDLALALSLDRVHLGGDFETLDLRISTSGAGEVAGDVTFVPHGPANLVCSELHVTLAARLGLPQQERSLQLQRAGTENRENGLVLTYRLPATPLQVRFDPPPVAGLLQQNAGKLVLSCPVPAAVLATLVGFPATGFVFVPPLRNEILRDQFEIPVPESDLPVVIPGQAVQIGDGEVVRIVPTWGEKAIVLMAR